jgi:hypothetical protein
MHFRSDEKLLKLTKILVIKNKGNFRGVCSDIPLAKMTLLQYILVSVIWNTLVQVGVKGVCDSNFYACGTNVSL